MRIIGFDPGLDGAFAQIDTDTFAVQVFDMPTFEVKEGRVIKRKIDSSMLAWRIRELDPHRAYIEKVGAMPGQGVTSMFNFGFSAGIIQGALAGVDVPWEYITPQKWQALVKMGKGKDASRAKAAKLFPNVADLLTRKKDNGRSDAILIAYAGSQEMMF